MDSNVQVYLFVVNINQLFFSIDLKHYIFIKNISNFIQYSNKQSKITQKDDICNEKQSNFSIFNFTFMFYLL